VLVASRRPDLVWLASRRPSVKYPQEQVWLSQEANPDFDREVAELARLLCERGGVVVSFLPPDFGGESFASLEPYARLRPVGTYGDGALLAVTGLVGEPDRTCRAATVGTP
jgi:hypothetical protein